MIQERIEFDPKLKKFLETQTNRRKERMKTIFDTSEQDRRDAELLENATMVNEKCNLILFKYYIQITGYIVFYAKIYFQNWIR